MNRIAFMVVSISCFTACGPGISRSEFDDHETPVFINEHVGDNIDSTESEKYGLFRGIDGFVKAVLYGHPRGGYEWEIFTTEAKLVARNENPLAVQILADYLARHDEIVHSAHDFEKTWGIVDYDILGLAITQDELDYVTEQLNSERNLVVGVSSGIGCCLGGFLGGLLQATLSERTSTNNPNQFFDLHIDIPEEGIAIGAAIGAGVFGGLAMLLEKSNAEKAVNIIKEERKPRVVE